MKKNYKPIIVLVLIASVACTASFATVAYRTLGTTITSVDTAMKVYGDQVRAGKIDQPTQDKVKAAYLKYYTAMGAAKSALDSYAQNQDQPLVQKALDVVAAAYSDLISLLQQFGVKV